MGRSVGKSRYRRSKSKKQKKRKKNLKRKRKNVPMTKKIQQKKSIDVNAVLNVHCLLKIFGYLDIFDLANVAACTNFKSIARDVFLQKFARDAVEVTNNCTTAGQLPSVWILVHFGDLITKLSVDYTGRSDSRFDHELEDAISEYCGKTAIEIEFKRCSDFAFFRIERPFEAVTKVLFTSCKLGSLVSKFNKLFPKARSLDFMGEYRITACVVQNFPQLNYLGFCDSCGGGGTNYSIITAINLNPQLTSLTLKPKDNVVAITPGVLFAINEKLPLLDTLDIQIFHQSFPVRDVRIIHFKNLRKLTIVFYGSTRLLDFAITTRQAAKLTLNGKWLDRNLGKFLSRNTKWTRIVIHGPWASHRGYDEFKNEIVKLKLLKSIEMSANGLKGKEKDVLALLNGSRSLNELKVTAIKFVPNRAGVVYRGVFSDVYDYSLNETVKYSDDGTFLETYRNKFERSFKDSVWLSNYEAQDNEVGDHFWTAYSAEYEKQFFDEQ